MRDRAAMAAWIGAADTARPFDLAIANAGITTGLGPNDLSEDPEAVRAIIATNLIGVLNTAEAADRADVRAGPWPARLRRLDRRAARAALRAGLLHHKGGRPMPTLNRSGRGSSSAASSSA